MGGNNLLQLQGLTLFLVRCDFQSSHLLPSTLKMSLATLLSFSALMATVKTILERPGSVGVAYEMS